MLGVTDEVAREILALEEAQRRLTVRERAREDFLAFVRHVYGGFIQSTHHKKIATQFERLAVNNGSRIIINLPPRHTKSELPVAGMAYWPQSRIKNHSDHAYGGTGGTVWP